MKDNNIQIIEINQEKTVEKKLNNKKDTDNYYKKKIEEDKINERKRRRIIFIIKTYNLFIFNLVCFYNNFYLWVYSSL